MTATPRLREARALLERFLSAWGAPDVAARVTIEVSPRLHRSLAIYSPAGRTIRLSRWLVDEAPDSLYRETIGHEAAHALVHDRNGNKRRRPHGREWRALMTEAGLPLRARIRIERSLGDRPAKGGSAPSRPRWLHRCPVCQVERWARRPVRQWRCRRCRESGLSGELEIERHERHAGAA